MNRYIYRAIDKRGQKIKGEIEAASIKQANEALSYQNLTPTDIREKDFLSLVLEAFDFSSFLNMFQSIKLRDQIVFFRQMAALFGAGVPLFESLQALEEQFTDEKFKKIITKVKEDVEAGLSLSAAMYKHPMAFNHLVVAMVGSGEKAGVMEDTLKRIAGYLERDSQLRDKIKAAMRYPILVITFLTMAFIAAILMVIPKFSSLFSELGGQLPLPTRILMGINSAILGYWFIVVPLLVLGGLSLKVYLQSSLGRRQWDTLILKLPVFGMLVTKVSLARFFGMFSSMLGSGVTLIEGLEITTSTADNVVIAESIARVREKVTSGLSVSAAMKQQKVFPPIAIQMVAIGEKSGTLEGMLNKCAEYFNEESDYTIGNLTSLLEPFVLLILAVFVATLAMGIFLPMVSVLNLYQRY